MTDERESALLESVPDQLLIGGEWVESETGESRPFRPPPAGAASGVSTGAAESSTEASVDAAGPSSRSEPSPPAVHPSTPATMAMLIREGSGIVCLCIRPDQASRLKLKPMVEVNRSRYATAYCAQQPLAGAPHPITPTPQEEAAGRYA